MVIKIASSRRSRTKPTVGREREQGDQPAVTKLVTKLSVTAQISLFYHARTRRSKRLHPCLMAAARPASEGTLWRRLSCGAQPRLAARARDLDSCVAHKTRGAVALSHSVTPLLRIAQARQDLYACCLRREAAHHSSLLNAKLASSYSRAPRAASLKMSSKS